MALIEVSRHRREDLAAWRVWEREDAAWSRTEAFRDKCQEAIATIAEFAAVGPCYVGVSWGKDSVTTAHLAWSAHEEGGYSIPLGWIRWDDSINPYCPVVRDTFLERWPMAYREEPATWHGDRDPELVWQSSIRRLQSTLGRRWIGGIRSEESGQRKRRIDNGLIMRSSCQPIGHWTARDVFAYLYAYDLPIHPAYGFTFGGSLDRGRLRVDALLGGRDVVLEERGIGLGRREWENAYYGDSR